MCKISIDYILKQCQLILMTMGEENRRDVKETEETAMKRGNGERQMSEHKRKQRSSEPAVSWPKRIINS